MTKEQAEEYKNKWMIWRTGLNCVYYVFGMSAAALAAAAAAYAKGGGNQPITLAIASAVAGFVVTLTNAGKRGRSFERAARKIERALVQYKTSEDEKILTDAAVAGLDELDASGA